MLDDAVTSTEEATTVETTEAVTGQGADTGGAISWRGRTLTASEAEAELKKFDAEMTRLNQERKKPQESTGTEQQVTQATLTPEEEAKRNALGVIDAELTPKIIERVKAELAAEQERARGVEALDKLIDKTISSVEAKSKEFNEPGVVPNEQEMTRIKDLVHNHGLHPDEAYQAVKGFEMNQAYIRHGESFTPKNLNTAPAQIQGKSAVEENGDLTPNIKASDAPGEQLRKLQELSRRFQQSNPFETNY